MNQAQAYTIENLFENYPKSQKLYEHIKKFIMTLGPVEINVTKTQVSFGMKTKFAWVWLPQLWIKKQPADSITLTFDSPKQIKDPLIKQSVESHPVHWTHHVVISQESDLNNKVRIWLQKAYQASSTGRNKSVKPRL